MRLAEGVKCKTSLVSKVLVGCLVLGSLGLARTALAQIAIVPPSPKAQEIVMLTVPQGAIGWPAVNIPGYDTFNTRGTRVEMRANRINVSVEMGSSDFPESPPSSSLTMPLGQFPAGTYEVEVSRRMPNGASAGIVGVATFIVSHRTATDPLWNHTDQWWNPSESGWGLNIVQHGTGIIFATWFVYDADRRPIWYFVPEGRWVWPERYEGPLYRTTGPPFQACGPYTCPPFDPASVNATWVGSAVLEFSSRDANNAFLTFTTAEGTIRRSLVRQSF